MFKSENIIGNRLIGSNHPTLILAEIGQAHEGSLGLAHSYIDLVADAGADGIKFQTHYAAEESTRDEPFRIQFSSQDTTRFDYWRRMEFTKNQWEELFLHASDRGLLFLSSAFSVKAVKMLASIGIPAWKMGAGEFRSPDLLKAMAEYDLPILCSTGMANWQEIDSLVNFFKGQGLDFVLMQCTSMYPTPLSKVGLNVITEIGQRYECLTGLSDHSGSLFPGLAALSHGISVLEVHVVFNKKMFGPDTSSSLTGDELKLLCDARDSLFEMYTNPVDKDMIAEDLKPMRALFSKSLAPADFYPAGTVIKASMLTLKKPGTGIPGDMLPKLEGCILARDVYPDKLISWDDIEGV